MNLFDSTVLHPCRICGKESGLYRRTRTPRKYCVQCLEIRRSKPAMPICPDCGNSCSDRRSVRCGECDRKRRALPLCKCLGCGCEFKKTNTGKNAGKYHSRECFFAWKNRRHQTRKRKDELERLKRLMPVKRICARCSRPFEGPRNGSRYCSDKCLYNYIPVKPTRRQCLICECRYYGKGKRKWCDRCEYKWKSRQKADCKRRRAMRLAMVPSDRYLSVDIFIRDKWICQLCGFAVDRKAYSPEPMAPTIDHIIPIARGGHDTIDNVQCAHFRCNSIKGDSILDVSV